MAKWKVIQYGLGAMGSQMVKLMLQKKEKFQIVGAIGGSPRKVGMDLGRAIGLDEELGIKVSGDAKKTFNTVDADVVLETTVSELEEAFSRTRGALETGKNVITIAEEAANPGAKSTNIAQEIDEVAKKNNVTFLGTGVNPGFMMDYLPIALTGVLMKVSKIHIRRVVDWSRYGRTPWEHLGTGKSIEHFDEARAKGMTPHIGLWGSAELVAKALGWTIDDFKETVEAWISKTRRESELGVVEPGTVCGYTQVGRGFQRNEEVITLELIGIVKPSPKEDGVEVGNHISIKGIPSVEVILGGEFAGQGGWATVAHAVNSIPQVIAAPPGLITPLDLPPSACL